MNAPLAGLRPFTLAMVIALILGGTLALRRPAAPSAAAPAQATVTVEIRNFAFMPSSITVAPNTTVRWVNRDASPHDVYGVLDASDVRSPTLNQGDAYEYTFNLPGIYDYICTFHPDMIARVVVQGAPDTYTFPETGFTVKGPFLTYWMTHGLEFGDYNVTYRESLALFGYPISNEIRQKLGDQEYVVQYFERARLELHPENADPDFQVLLGQFGRILHPLDPAAAQLPGQTYYRETGHNLGGRFRAYWNENGGLAIFGFPISEEFQERLEDGKTYRVQYFERARFEAHPENPAPYDVLLGQFGRLVLAR